MTKWEYKFLWGNLRKVESELIERGAEGWEAISMHASAFWVAVLLKRQIT